MVKKSFSEESRRIAGFTHLESGGGVTLDIIARWKIELHEKNGPRKKPYTLIVIYNAETQQLN